MSFVDASGNKREEVRIRWWDPVGFSDKAQHFSRVTIEQRAQPAPGKVGGRGGLNGTVRPDCVALVKQWPL